MNYDYSSNDSMLRHFALLEGEESILNLQSQEGLSFERSLDHYSQKVNSLLITNLRVLCFVKKDGKSQNLVAPIKNVEGVKITTEVKESGSLITGGLFVLTSLIVGGLVYSSQAPVVAAILVTLALFTLGIINLSRYFFPDNPSNIVINTTTLEMSIPLKSDRAIDGAFLLGDYIFQLKSGLLPEAIRNESEDNKSIFLPNIQETGRDSQLINADTFLEGEQQEIFPPKEFGSENIDPETQPPGSESTI